MPRPSAADIRAVALDLDGSLAGADHRVSARASRALSLLQARGVTPVIVTGRTAAAARTPSEQAGLSAPVISCNGAVIEDPTTGERLWEHHLPADVVTRVLSVAQRADLTTTLWTADHVYASRRDDAVELLGMLLDEPVHVGALSSVAARPLVKAMLAGSAARLDEVADLVEAELPHMMRSMDSFFEMSAPDASKAGALREVLGRLSLTPAQCLGIGDGDTDIEWLSMVGLAVAPSNARPGVRALADRVIGHHAKDGVATFLEELFSLTGDG